MPEQHANAVIKRALNLDGVKLYKYYCQLCFGWHVTKQEQHPERLEAKK